MNGSTIHRVSSDTFELAEGGRWVDGEFVFVDIPSGRLLTAADDDINELIRLDVPLGAVAPITGHPGDWIAAAGTGIALIKRCGTVEWLAEPAGDRERIRMNDGAADPAGRFWAGSMAYANIAGAGSLYRVTADGCVAQVLDGLTIPNGPAFTSDGETMYLAESATGQIDRFTVTSAGELTAREVFLSPGHGYGTPDGMTVDDEGNLWAAFWGGFAVRRLRPDGSLDVTIELPARQPTSVCLGGATGQRLFITTARHGIAGQAAADGGLFWTEVDIPGRAAAAYTPKPGHSISAQDA